MTRDIAMSRFSLKVGLHDGEVVLASKVKSFFSDLSWPFQELAIVRDLEQEVTRVAVSQRSIVRQIVFLDQVLDQMGTPFKLVNPTHDLK